MLVRKSTGRQCRDGNVMLFHEMLGEPCSFSLTALLQLMVQGDGYSSSLYICIPGSRMEEGTKERVTDSGQLSCKETSKNRYTTLQYSELSKSLIRKGGWLLFWDFCYYGISGTASNFSHTHKPSTTVDLSLFAPKYHSLCASHFCQTIISFWNFLVFLLCLKKKKKKKLIHSSRLSSYFLSLVSIYYMPDAVLRTMHTLILFSRLPHKIGLSSTPLPAHAVES